MSTATIKPTEIKPSPPKPQEMVLAAQCCWREDVSKYTVELRMTDSELRRLGKFRRDVWLPGEKGNILVGAATNFRTTELTDRRVGVPVCTLEFNLDIWLKGWDGPTASLRLWAEKGLRRLKVMDFEIIGPCAEVQRYG